MTALLYFLFIFPLSHLPMSVLYRISDFLFLFFKYLKPYRHRVVIENLTRSFPGYTKDRIDRLADEYYRHMADLIVESVKAFTISESEIRKRLTCKNPELLKPYLVREQSVLVGGGHYNNWEWYGVGLGLSLPLRSAAIYKPLSNGFFEKKMKSTRSRFGLEMVPMKEVEGWIELEKLARKPFFLSYGSDQSPGSPSKAHWMTFLNQDTPVVYGIEKHARLFDLPVLFAVIRKKSRGYYEVELSHITDQPESHPKGWIVEEIAKRLESEIVKDPRYWLWSHRRWKHKR